MQTDENGHNLFYKVNAVNEIKCHRTLGINKVRLSVKTCRMILPGECCKLTLNNLTCKKLKTPSL